MKSRETRFIAKTGVMSLNCNARTIRSKKSEPVYSTDECLSKNIQQNAFALAKMMAAQ
jgi:hypothetical protein